MTKNFEITLNMLNHLDESRATLVHYYKPTKELILYQHGGIILRLSHLVGYLKPHRGDAVLFPNDLIELKNILKFVINSTTPIMIYPITSGYKLYGIGDVTYTSSPKYLTNLKFYSVKDKLSIWWLKLFSEEVKLLFNLIKSSS